MKIYLDLLPEERKKELRRSKIFRLALKQEVFFILPLLMLAGILMGANLTLKIQKESVAEQNSQAQAGDRYQELDVYEKKFKEANGLSSELIRIRKAHLNWADRLGELGLMVPEGVSLTNISTKNYKMMLAGRAATRDKLLEFKGNLEKDSCMSDVNLPLSNIVQKENVDFQMDFSIKEECLRER